MPGPLLTRMQAQARLSAPRLPTAPGWLPNKPLLKSGSKVLAAKRRWAFRLRLVLGGVEILFF